MIGSLMMCVGAVVLLIGMLAGIAMGIEQDFALAPAHAHLNLAGGVLLFLFGEPDSCFRLSPLASQTPIKPVITYHSVYQLVSACVASFHPIIGGNNGGYFHGNG
jgi:hypothetical protein